jgi:hypothetical protein
MFQTKFLEKNTPFVFNNFFSENRAGCEITWKIMVEPDRPQWPINIAQKKCDLRAG